jgi:rhodanese-related sulfurtransferase
VQGFGTPLPMTPHEVEEAVAGGAVVIDGRTNEQFDEAHIPGAISASGYDTGFATKVAEMVPVDAELLIVAASDGNELEAAELLAAVGLRVRGFLGGGMTAWRAEDRPVERIEAIDLEELARRLDNSDPPQVLDVRNEAEYAEGHIPGSIHIPFAQLGERIGELPRDAAIATICKAGKRSGLAASILQREGFQDVVHVSRGNAATWARRADT